VSGPLHEFKPVEKRNYLAIAERGAIGMSSRR
jgi:hypothetical protein